MKKAIAIILVLVLALGLVSCGKQEDSANTQTVIFYKDGMKTEVKDNDLYLEIVNVIESWYEGEEFTYGAELAATTDLIDEMRNNEMAIELPCVDEIKLDTGVRSGITVFIPLTGKHKNLLFRNTIQSPNSFSGPTTAGTGLEKFFKNVKFTPLSEEEKRWSSTVFTPGCIEFYENGQLIGKSEDMKGFVFNNKLAKHVESWFYKKDNVEAKVIPITPIETVWQDETYIKILFNGSSPKFYGEQIININHYILIIPLTGDYAYNIFSGEYEAMSNLAIDVQGGSLEQFFDEFKKQ